MELSIVNQDSHVNRTDLTGIKFILPCLGHAHSRSIRLDRIGIIIAAVLLSCLITGIIPA